MYRPQAGSLPHKVCLFFKENPGEELTRVDIAQKFGASNNAVEASLATALSHDVLRKRHDADLGMLYFAGANLAAIDLSGDSTSHTSSQRKVQLHRLPPLPIEGVKVCYDEPIPDCKGGKPGESRYAQLLDMLDKPGACAKLPLIYRGSLAKHVSKVNKAGGTQFVVRTIDNQTVGVWRQE